MCVLSLLRAQPCSCCLKDNGLAVLKFDFDEKMAFVGDVSHPNTNATLTGAQKFSKKILLNADRRQKNLPSEQQAPYG